MNAFRNCQAYKIDTQKSVTFPYPNNKHTDKETRKITPFTAAEEVNKFPGIHLSKEVKDICNKNF